MHISSGGYKKIKNENGTWVFEHVYLYEKEFGKIPKGNVVHHVDEDKLNNDLSNLVCMTRGDHASLHHKSHITEETKAKISAANLGKKRTEKHKANMSASSTQKKAIRCIELGIDYESERAASKVLGINRGNIWSALNGRLEKAGGYHFKYA